MEIKERLNALLALSAENEVVEFKEAKNSYDFKTLGKYFSALSNEANLMHLPSAWLAFGVTNQRQVVGTRFRSNRIDIDRLKIEIADKTTNRITFIEIHEVAHEKGRVILFEIPAAPKGLPISFYGHYYGRDGEALSPLNLEEIERIRAQATKEDWSAGIIADASIDDLDEEALGVARLNFKNKFPDHASDVDNWNDITFLNKAKLTIKGKITRTTILLLGKEEAEHFLLPSVGVIRWLLKDNQGNDRDYALFGIPFLLAVDKVYSKVRNLKYRYLQEGSLFPEEIDQYEPYSIREAINNCIAHQDYKMAGRINVVEREESLMFTNLGDFVPGNVERVVMEDAPEEYYRNHFLASAMFNLKMVDTAGGGIRKMFQFQRDRFFPMPDYDLSGHQVRVTITGKILNMSYARLLARDSSLSLPNIMALDKVQKHISISASEEKSLKNFKLIEGRKPNFFIAKSLAQKTDQKATYSRNRALHKDYYLKMIRQALIDHGSLTRKDIDELLWDKLPEWMNDEQRKNKVGNLIKELSKNNFISNEGSFKYPKWVLVKQNVIENLREGYE